MSTDGKREVFMRKFKHPLNLQFFADGNSNNGGDGQNAQNNSSNSAGEGNSTQNAGQSNNNNNNNGSGNTATTYTQEQLDGIVNTRVTRAEKAALKSFFEQQGMSEEEINNAISAYKAQKKANEPDVAGMKSQLTQYQQEKQQLLLEKAATTQAIKSGISIDTVPYVLKMADFSKAVGTEGKVVDDEIKNAIDKVLEDVPALKPSNEATKGFSFGAPNNSSNAGTNNSNNSSSNNVNKTVTKRWNRFN